MTIINNQFNNLSLREIEALLVFLTKEYTHHTYLYDEEDMESLMQDIVDVKDELDLRRRAH